MSITDPEARPSVCIVLYAFEEERFVGDAARSLLAQDYDGPLEIVLSDDGSKDRTFEIMSELARRYAGPHRILLNRNPTNLGIGAQINRAIEMTTGRLVVLANGDDLYPPHRVSRLVETWAREGRPTAVWSDAEQIDADGRPRGVRMKLGRVFETLEGGVKVRFGGPGATCLMLDRKVFEAFGPIPDNMLLEDNPLFMRGFLLGPVRYVDEPLVQYRVHDDNISQVYHTGDFEDWRARRRKRAVWHAREGCRAFIEMLRDMHQAPATGWPARDLSRARWAAIERVCHTTATGDFLSGDQALSERERWGFVARLALLQFKLTLKRFLPWIDRRNEAWEFRQYQKLD